jgi:hypothetical protein
MQKNSKRMIFLICLQFSVINGLYANAIWKPKQVICWEKAVFWRGYTGNPSNQLWQVAALPAFASDAFR